MSTATATLDFAGGIGCLNAGHREPALARRAARAGAGETGTGKELIAKAIHTIADGTPFELPPVHLPKSGVQIVDVNAALANAPDKLRGHVSTWGNASYSYRYDWQGAVDDGLPLSGLVHRGVVTRAEGRRIR